MKPPPGNRILMLLENNPYPQDSRVRWEAAALVAAGYRVTVVAPAEKNQPARETVDGVDVWRYPAPPAAKGFLGYLWEYAYSTAAALAISVRIFRREGFDVVHAHNPPDTFVFIAALYKLLGKRFVYDHHDLSPEMYYARFPGRGSRLVYAALVALEQLSCRLADHVIATNESYKRMEMERGGVAEHRITVVRNWTSLHLAPPVAPDRELKQMNKTIIGFVGVMGYQDGVEHLLRALHHLVHGLGRTDFYSVLIGAGDAWNSLRELARRLALDDYVRFTGFVPDEEMLRYLNAADICVDPDPRNPFTDRSTMIKMMEYMALGKPIVAFDLAEHRVTAGAAAVYAPANDERAFARALVRLMDDPERRAAMGAAGRRRLKEVLAGDRIVPRLLGAFSKVLPLPVEPQSDPARDGRSRSLILGRTACPPGESPSGQEIRPRQFRAGITSRSAIPR